jgi:hypothetical protein
VNISVLYNGDTYITDIVQSVEWSGDVQQAYRSVDISLINTIDGVQRAITFELGKEIRFYSEEVELFRGVIFRTSIDCEGAASIIAYDENVYLTKNTDTRKFTNATATQIIRQLCADFDVASGSLTDTGYVIPSLVLRDMTLWNMITTALTLTYKQTGRRYYVYASQGTLRLSERKERTAAYIIESASTLTAASYTQSIDEMRNRVKVIGGDPDKNPISAVAGDSASEASYGRMQHLETADYDAKQAEITQLAERLLTEMNVIDDEATVAALGYDDTYAGVSVYVYDEMTGITGSYYVSSDTHTYANGLHTMSLTLSATDDLPTLEYTPPPAAKKKKSNGSDDSALFSALGL